ncbi:hypothetical protein ACUXI4_000536 [Pantoea piersonii]|jgi:hypothetical protein
MTWGPLHLSMQGEFHRKLTWYPTWTLGLF